MFLFFTYAVHLIKASHDHILLWSWLRYFKFNFNRSASTNETSRLYRLSPRRLTFEITGYFISNFYRMTSTVKPRDTGPNPYHWQSSGNHWRNGQHTSQWAKHVSDVAALTNVVRCASGESCTTCTRSDEDTWRRLPAERRLNSEKSSVRRLKSELILWNITLTVAPWSGRGRNPPTPFKIDAFVIEILFEFQLAFI